MKECKFFGFDKYMFSIYEDSIISFKESGKSKIGHLWYYEGDIPSWVISFNHLYSETSISYELFKHKIRNIRVIGHGKSDEKLLKKYFER